MKPGGGGRRGEEGGRGPHVLEIRDLTVWFDAPGAPLRAVDGVSLTIGRGETLGLVGESGCGKTATALSILRLIPERAVSRMSGAIRFAGRDGRTVDLLQLSESQIRRVRGREIAMIFQEPLASLNPVMTVGRQIAEVIGVHEGRSRAAARKVVLEALSDVGIPSPEATFDAYPHELSGGMRQRVMVAMALVCRPSLLVADEPTTALDATIQAQILDLLRRLRTQLGMSILLIAHDLGVVAEMADRVAVMYAGRVVECGPAAELYEAPLHPYTFGLFRSLPEVRPRKGRLYAIPGGVPDLRGLPAGCAFHPRCPLAEAVCREVEPWLAALRPGHQAACHVVAREISRGRSASALFEEGNS